MTRKLTLALALLIALPATAVAQGVEEMKKRHAAKLAEPWLEANPWLTDYEKAQEEATDQGKLIFGYFTRSFAP